MSFKRMLITVIILAIILSSSQGYTVPGESRWLPRFADNTNVSVYIDHTEFHPVWMGFFDTYHCN
jgi:hypothetical protein